MLKVLALVLERLPHVFSQGADASFMLQLLQLLCSPHAQSRCVCGCCVYVFVCAHACVRVYLCACPCVRMQAPVMLQQSCSPRCSTVHLRRIPMQHCAAPPHPQWWHQACSNHTH